MFVFRMSGSASANVRFCLSPLWVSGRVLRGNQIRGAWPARSHQVLHEGRTPLLAALHRTGPGYVPDFLTPTPRGYEADVHDELHQVASVPADRVAAEMAVVFRGSPRAGIPARRPSRTLLEQLDCGERLFAEKVARELDQFWRKAIAPRWRELRAGMEADIMRRAQQTARGGISAMVDGLHPAITWQGENLRIASSFQASLDSVSGIVLMPVPVGTGLEVSVDPTPLSGLRQPRVVYPASGATAPSDSTAGTRARGELLGTTREMLLTDLRVARSTTELAARHGLSPSTVSYHLGVLHRSGLISRCRERRHVRYERTERGTQILFAGGDRDRDRGPRPRP